MIKAVVCTHSVTKKSPRKTLLFESLYSGLKNQGVNVVLSDDHTAGGPYDLALIFGYTVYSNGKPTGSLRERIIKYQNDHGKKLICIDDAHLTFSLGQKATKMGMNTPFYNSGKFYNENSTSDRWDKLFAPNITINDWRKNGNHILMMLQNSKNFSTCGQDNVEWALDTMAEIRKHSDRRIVVRPHPATPLVPADIEKFNNIKNIEIKLGTRGTLHEELENCWAAVTYSSGSAIESVIKGIPTFLGTTISMATPVCNLDFSKIEKPEMPDRMQWAYNYANCAWLDEEIAEGLFWNNLQRGMEE